MLDYTFKYSSSRLGTLGACVSSFGISLLGRFPLSKSTYL